MASNQGDAGVPAANVSDAELDARLTGMEQRLGEAMEGRMQAIMSQVMSQLPSLMRGALDVGGVQQEEESGGGDVGASTGASGDAAPRTAARAPPRREQWVRRGGGSGCRWQRQRTGLPSHRKPDCTTKVEDFLEQCDTCSGFGHNSEKCATPTEEVCMAVVEHANFSVFLVGMAVRVVILVEEIRDVLRSPGNPSNGSAGAVKLVVTTRNGRVYDVEARQTETVLRLKSQLTGQWRLPKEIMFQALKFNGELLEEGRTLESYNIVEGSTHKLFVVPRKVVSNLKATWHEDRPLLTTGKRDWWEDAIAESDEITGPFSLDDLSANEGVETDAATAEDPDRPSMEVEKPGKGVGNMSRHIIPAGSQAGPSPAASAPFSGSDAGVESASIDDLFRQHAADFSGLHELILQDPTIVRELRELVSEHRGSFFPDAEADRTPIPRRCLMEVDKLVKMASVLQEVASAKAQNSEIQRKELALEPGSFEEAYHTALRGGIYRSYLAASVIASDMVTTSKTGAMGKASKTLKVLAGIVSIVPGLTTLAAGLEEGDRCLQTRRIIKITDIAADSSECCTLARSVAMRLTDARSVQQSRNGVSSVSFAGMEQGCGLAPASRDREGGEDGKDAMEDAMEWFVEEVLGSHPTSHGHDKNCAAKEGQRMGKSHLKMILKAVGQGCLGRERSIDAKVEILVRVIVPGAPGVQGKTTSAPQGPRVLIGHAASCTHLLPNHSGVAADRPVDRGDAVESERRVAMLVEQVKTLEAGHAALSITSAELVARNAELEVRLETSSAKNTELVAQNAKLEASVETANATIAELVASKTDLQASVESTRKTSAGLVAQNSKLEESLEASMTECTEIAEQNAKLEASVEASTATIADLVAQNTKLEGGLEASRAATTKLIAQNAELKAELEASSTASAELVVKNAELEAGVEASKATIAELVVQNADLEASVEASHATIEDLVTRNTKLEGGLEASKATTLELAAQNAKLEAGLEASNVTSAKLVAKNAELEAGLEASKATIAALVARNTDLEASVKASSATVADLVAQNAKLEEGWEASKATSEELTAQNEELVAHNAKLAELESAINALKKQIKPAPESAEGVDSGGGLLKQQRAATEATLDGFFERTSERATADDDPVTQRQLREILAVQSEINRELDSSIGLLQGAFDAQKPTRKRHR
eukprot:g10892.t1